MGITYMVSLLIVKVFLSFNFDWIINDGNDKSNYYWMQGLWETSIFGYGYCYFHYSLVNFVVL